MDAAAQPTAVLEAEIQGWELAWTEVEQRLARYFARAEARQRATAYLQGLLSITERKNSWQLAEITGDTTPYGFQHLLGRADWDPDALRDRLRTYVTDSTVVFCRSRLDVLPSPIRTLRQAKVGAHAIANRGARTPCDDARGRLPGSV